ncbi:DUF2087 domain-containing protein [Kitasatospora fiedleri]|uniref:DUF2087 domain-containing protein n=1 Tax=Kitasatospora fiedleri TaxID=2991545 RepID=UPI002499AEC0|nr:DUF2087 domain-containing protein [Kitasatospora fiedleri]
MSVHEHRRPRRVLHRRPAGLGPAPTGPPPALLEHLVRTLFDPERPYREQEVNEALLTVHPTPPCCGAT